MKHPGSKTKTPYPPKKKLSTINKALSKDGGDVSSTIAGGDN
jgi:hypothetical protein